MSNARICVYLDSKNTVHKFLNKIGVIQVIEGKPLVNPAKRLLISNVCPIKPNDKIEFELTSQLGLKLASPVSYLRAGCKQPEFSHIRSAIRAVYYNIESDKEPIISDSLTLNYQDEEFRIFLSTENTRQCFLCKKNGHSAKSCPESANRNVTSSDILKPPKRPAPTTESDNMESTVR